MSLNVNSLFNVKGKTAVVTGGSSGIGYMFASAYIQNGANVIIAARKEKQLKQATDSLNKVGPGKCEYVVADLGSKAGCEALSAEVHKRVKKVHILVNNSGATWGAKYNDVPEKEGWDKILSLNVKSLFYMTQLLTDLLASNSSNTDPGRVINVASIAGISSIAEDSGLGAPGTGLWSYHASKAAAINLTKTLAVTLGPQCVTVNAVLPGVYPSKMTAYGFKHGGDVLSSIHPMGRAGSTEDMAGLALFLGSRASSHLSGVAIETDGGSFIAGRGMAGGARSSKL